MRIQYNSAFETSLLWIPLDSSPFEAPAIQLSRHGSPQAQWACHGAHGGSLALVGARTEIGLLIWSSFMAILLLSWPSIYCQFRADLTYSHLIYIYILHSFCYIKVYAQELPTGKGSADDPAAVSLSINWPSAIMKLVQQNWESYQR